MTLSVKVSPSYPWAVIPQQVKDYGNGHREERKLLEEHFKYYKDFRNESNCPPWVIGQRVGFEVLSPVSVNMTEIRDLQFSSEEDPQQIAKIFALTDFWARPGGYIGVSRNSWIRSFVYRNLENQWQSMFIPNGHGTIEWHLGIQVSIPDGYYLQISNHPASNLTIPSGILTKKQLEHQNTTGGMSLAIEPRHTQIMRMDPIAKITLLHRDSIQAQLETE